MRVYHGSTMIVKKPVVQRGRRHTDFGKGFYVTMNMEQAKNWALIRQRNIGDGAKAVVSIYELDDELPDRHDDYNILRFEAPDESWLVFVNGCRDGRLHDYDMVVGPVADDRIYETLELYKSGVLTTQETVARLKINEFYNQISFHSPVAVRELRFAESMEV